MTTVVDNSTRLTGWYSDPQQPGRLLWWNGSAFERDGRSAALSFKEAIREGLTDWSFSGRASRSAYWFFSLFTILVARVPVSILRIVGWLIGNKGQAWLSESDAARAVLVVAAEAQSLFLVLCSVILFKLWVKRMHDRDIGGPARLGGRVLVYFIIPSTVLFLSRIGVFVLSSQVKTYVQLLLAAVTLWVVVELCLPGHRHVNRYNVEAPITPQ
jgi:uncharacterized membrane protein YhaH (DUF805 family)